MNELIKITTTNEGKRLVSARELHEFLKVKQDFSDWIKKQLESVEAKEGEEFSLLKGETSETGGRPTLEYIITLDTAKEINMIAGIAPRANKETKELSKQARKYFIECEKKLKEVTTKQLPQDYLTALKELVRLEEEKALMQPKIEYYENVLNPGTFTKLVTSSAIAKDLGISAIKLNKILIAKEIIYKGKDKVYHITEYGQSLKFTEKGREWIIGLLKEELKEVV